MATGQAVHEHLVAGDGLVDDGGAVGRGDGSILRWRLMLR
jgi:hypothetical protein